MTSGLLTFPTIVTGQSVGSSTSTLVLRRSKGGSLTAMGQLCGWDLLARGNWCRRTEQIIHQNEGKRFSVKTNKFRTSEGKLSSENDRMRGRNCRSSLL